MAGVAALAACHLATNGLEPASLDDDAGADSAADSAVADGGAAETAPGDEDSAPPPVGPPDFAWYLLNETSGVVAHDSTANHYDVANLTGVTWGQGASFDGTGGGGSVVVAAELRQAPVTLTAWLAPDSRVDEGANSHGITPFPPNAVSGDAPGQFGYGLGLDVWSGGSALAVEDVGYTFQGVAGAPFAVGIEYFVAAAIGATTAIVYVDGQYVGQAAPMVPGATPATTLSLGVHNQDPAYGTKRFYAGRMRDVRVYKRVLTAADVAMLRAAGPATGP